ncbi:MAG TPA: AraC family transcriptional regulator [Candidatus Limnocylindrales bacterium]|nr:AraC family transcriptional regulator [Candidatus Limnocylindrales bacterium]
MIDERVLLDDGTLAVADVRCHGAPAAPSGEEAARALEVNIPLAGVYVRTVRRPASPGSPRRAIGDPGRALVFARDEPYRVSHPIGGDDRSLVIAVLDPPPDLELRTAERPVPAGVPVVARRLAGALADGRLDALAGAEVAMAIVRTVGRGTAWSPPARPRELRLAAAVRLEIGARLGERLTLADLGRAAGLSGWELARRFRRATGTSIHRYRTARRVQVALERIEAGERDLTGLALDLGFADHSHLTNVLRRETGRPPSAFRHAPTAAELGALRTILQA